MESRIFTTFANRKNTAMRIFLSIISIIMYVASWGQAANLHDAIDSLDGLINRRGDFMEKHRHCIDSIEREISHASNSIDLAFAYKTIADSFRRYNIDSAIYYYDRAMANIADVESTDYKRIAWAKSSIMPVNGLVLEACRLYEENTPSVADSAYISEYYANGVEMYLYITDYHTLPVYRYKYAGMAMELNDSLLNYLSPGSDQYRFHKAYRYSYDGEHPLAVAELDELLKSVKPTDNMYARAHAMLADYYSREGREEEAMYHLALAASGDIIAATQEFTALKRLGMKLYEEGDVRRAYTYMMLALESSLAAGSRLRTLENARSLPIIAKSFRDVDRMRMTWIFIAMSVLVCAFAVIVVMMVMMRRKQKRVEELQRRLKDNVQLKDAYIGQVLSMCSSYIERMEEFNRLAGRKIKAGQVQDLYHMIESGKILQEQATQFYEVFDKAFFGIYPDFVDRVNELLLPEKRIVLSSPGRLTPECRILAFMRLGIDDSAKLSKFLGLSLNTIYTYRNKLKSRAVDRENFESEIKKIGDIQ